jgi:hypothetical protein
MIKIQNHKSLFQKYPMLTTFHKVSRSFYGKLFIAEVNNQERPGLMSKLSQSWSHIQTSLFRFLETEVSPLTATEKRFVATLDLIELDRFIPMTWLTRGRPSKDRTALARAFVAKPIFQLATTRQLMAHLHSNSTLRRLCGWERPDQIPSEPTFSRAFSEFAQIELPVKVHEAVIERYQSERLVGHLSRDSSDIPAREEPAPKSAKSARPKAKRGRPRKGEVRPPKEPTVVERQLGMSLPEMLGGLPRSCNFGTKKKPSGAYHWIGYKLHLDWADGEIPISWILTSASVHDSQVAIPLGTMSAGRVQNCYALMDSAYDSPAIWEHSRLLGVVPIIDFHHRRREVPEMDLASQQRYRERTTAERGFSLLKEKFGGRDVWVKGNAKVLAHLGFCLLALTADRLLNLLL